MNLSKSKLEGIQQGQLSLDAKLILPQFQRSLITNGCFERGTFCLSIIIDDDSCR